MTAKFTFHTDPGHGWLEVTLSDLAKVGLSRADFSPYSYENPILNGGTLYLEEDCDAGVFIKAWEQRFGKPELTDSYAQNIFVRRLPHLDNPNWKSPWSSQ